MGNSSSGRTTEIWTNALDASLKRLWNEGMKTEAIAADLSNRFKVDLSKNAVIGRAHRLDLKLRRNGFQRGNKHSPYHRIKPRKAPPAVIQPPVQRISIPEDKWASLPNSRPRMLIDLDNGKCKFPVNSAWDQPATEFCGEPADDGCPYCKYHRLVAYHPSTEMRREVMPH